MAATTCERAQRYKVVCSLWAISSVEGCRNVKVARYGPLGVSILWMLSVPFSGKKINIYCSV